MPLGSGIMAVVFSYIVPGLMEGQRNYPKLRSKLHGRPVRIVQPGPTVILATAGQHKPSNLTEYRVFFLLQFITQHDACLWFSTY